MPLDTGGGQFPYISERAHDLLVRAKDKLTEIERFPLIREISEGQQTQHGTISKILTELVAAGYLSKPEHSWKSASITELGQAYVSQCPVYNAGLLDFCEEDSGQEGTSKQSASAISDDEGRSVKLPCSVHLLLAIIARVVKEENRFPDTAEIVRDHTDGKKNWARGHVGQRFRRLERHGLIVRNGGSRWAKAGEVTDRGWLYLQHNQLPDVPTIKKKSPARLGGGLAPDGGSLYPAKVFSASEMAILKPGSQSPKLGQRVRVGKAPHKGLPILSLSLEEGMTCDPNCDLRNLCYAGKMSQEKRVRYDGPQTDKAIARSIINLDEGPAHLRLHTVGDFPTVTYVEAVLAALTVSHSTSFGYTHWQPESEIGAVIRAHADFHWRTFAIRTSYRHGSRLPLGERAAVTVDDFTPRLLEMHDALPCPEQTGNVPDCGKCGLCWNTKQNIAFRLH